MKKLSFASVSIVLTVVLFYTFVFCTVNSADETVLQSAQCLTYDTAETEYLGTADTSKDTYLSENSEDFEVEETSIEVYKKYIETSWWKANLQAYTSAVYSEEQTTPQITSATTVTPATTVLTTTTAQTTTTAATTTTTSATTTTTPATTTTTTPATTTTPETTTTEAETTAQINNNEKLTYTVNGSKYSGNAYDVICEVVSAEMSSDFNAEALKAQAVAAYSYIKYHNQKGISPSVSIKTNIPSKIADAVRSVCGQAVYYNGSIAQTVYCSSTGGYTAAAKDVWGSDVPYLRSVVGEYDSYDRYYGVRKTFSEDEVRSIIENATGISLSNDPQNWITIVSELDGGYAGDILIDGNSYYTKNGNKINITGRVLRENIFSFRLNSTKFIVEYEDGNFVFTTYGYGHGVGMSQLGANLYANNGGYTYTQILEHYFPGATIS